MTVEMVGQATANTYGSTLNTSYASTAGNTLIACILHQSMTISGVSDTAGNTWVKATDATSYAGYECGIWYALDAAAVTSVTASGSASNAMAVTLSEWSGLSAFGAGATTTSASGFYGTTTSTIQVAADQGGLVIGCTRWANDAHDDTTDSVGSPYTALTDNAMATSYLDSAYHIATSGGSEGPIWTFTSNSYGSVAVASFSPEPSAPAMGVRGVIAGGVEVSAAVRGVIQSGAEATAGFQQVIGDMAPGGGSALPAALPYTLG